MAGAGPHILTFYVVRLAKPLLDLDGALRLDLENDFKAGGSAFEPAATSAPPDPPSTGEERGRFASRIDLGDPLSSLGLRGPLALPPSFGPVYLGEQFACLVSLACITGPAGAGAAAVAVRAELQTEGGRVVLHDSGESPLPLLHPGARCDFTLRHDVRALGPHTLVCTANYTVAVSGERKTLPAYFKFTAAPPLAVRTKVRSLPPPAVVVRGTAAAPAAFPAGSALVEATIDNLKAGPLCLEPPRFDAAPGLVAVRVGAPDPTTTPPLPIPPGGASSFVFAVSPADPSSPAPMPPGTPLGRLDLRWAAGSMGGPGRLQTQDVCAAPAAARAVALSVASLPASAPLATPFPITLLITSALDMAVGPLRLEPAGGDFTGDGEEEEEEGGGKKQQQQQQAGNDAAAPPPPPAVVFLHGDARPTVPAPTDDGRLPPKATASLAVSLVALAPGIHRLPALRLVDGGSGRVLDVLSGWVTVDQ